MANEKQVVLRMPEDLLERVNALVPKLAEDEAYAAFRVSRSSVIRLALQRGLEQLEAAASGRRSPSRRPSRR